MREQRTGEASVQPIYLQLAPEDIAFVKFVFESYEEVGIVRTVDRHTAIIVLLVAADFLPAARAIVQELQGKIACAEVSAPAIAVDDWLMREIEEA